MNTSLEKKIHVAMISQAYYPLVGGAERQLAALAPLLRARNVEVSVLTRRYKGLKPFEKIDDVPVYRLPAPGPKAVASLLFTLSALALLQRLRPDLIHAHELLSPTTTAVLAKRISGTPVVAKVLRGGQLGDVAKLKSRFQGRKRLAAQRRHVDAFITISREIDEELANLGIPENRRPFIPNGVDTDRFTPIAPLDQEALRRRLNLPEGLIVIYTGRLTPEKRIDQLISIWPQVRKVHPEATLLLLGTGDQEDALKQQAGSGIEFRGVVEDVAPYLKTATLFILPSATEGLSNSLLEAMAAGLPVIATNVGGAPDLITDDYNGHLIPPDNPDALTEATLLLLGDWAKRQQLGQQACLKVLHDYALPQTASKLRNLYDQLLTTQTSVTTRRIRQA
jgi:glycosyltransferase involved in cell wall biosynthesis